jgi:hypothetical protein
MYAITTGIDAWKDGPQPAEWDIVQKSYMEKWSRYDGSIFEGMADANVWGANQPAVYANTKLLWKHIEAVVDFYAGVIYQGALSTDGKELPDGTKGAIPIDPQTPNQTRDDLLLAAIAELWAAWNWQQQMSLRPMYAAALGDCLTEIVDDTDRRFVYPQIVWPGWVKEIELDYVGNVRAYTLEYRTQDKPDASGKPGTVYTYRKKVDGEAFRYYRDDKLTRTVANPYGFVPAVWDRHRLAAPNAVRGKSATDGTRQALYQLNSLFGHSFDFQHKAFEIPPMLATGTKMRDTTPPEAGTPPSSGKELAERYRIRYVPPDASLLQPTFDVGKTLEMIQDIREGILAENPEASFYQQMREMQQVTAPGAERLMGDVKNRVDLVRAGMDAGTVKLFQMAIAIAGFRARDTSEFGWSRRGTALDRRRLAFTQFDLQSFGRGELDMTILARPIVMPTEQERMETELLKVQVAEARERVTTERELKEIYPDLDETEFAALLAERRARESAMLLGDFGPIREEEVA